MAASNGASSAAPLVILGAGYAGLTVAEEVHRRSKGSIPIVVVDRHPIHVLRTELYEVGQIAAAGGDVARWTIPLGRVFDRTSVTVRQGSVESIDLARKVVRVDSTDVPYGSLAICLGNIAAYYGVPGAEEHTYNVYRLSGAQRLGRALVDIERASPGLPGERRPRVLVIGGGSTGTEVAAEIATTDWGKLTGTPIRPPDVFLLTGAFPFLAGFPPRLIAHARRTLHEIGVTIVPGLNVVRAEAGRLHLEDGSVFACDAAVWCAGVEAPALVRELPVPHGKGGRVATEPTLEVPGHPGVFAVGDVAEFRDPATGMLVPGTAQAALAEARTAAVNLVARAMGSPLEAFRYREKGVIVALGVGHGVGTVSRVSVWGSPARLLKQVVEREYHRAAERGEASRLV
ncbi:MAG: FAD-dependent oxidoreductase [Thermoplasmata archaeon]|nr:FAD-dependent oxidoreductase [Thermoplasmata archaeon]